MVLKKEGYPQISIGLIGREVAEVQIVRRLMKGRNRYHGSTNIGSRRPKCFMHRNVHLEASGRQTSELGRSLKTLQSLVPHGEHASLDDLFSETVDHIMGLQMTIKLMKIILLRTEKEDD